MSGSSSLAYAMMNGLGNEILVVDLRGGVGMIETGRIRALAAQPDFRFDQLMAIEDARSADAAAYVRIYNSDGSETGACGNGSRCVAWFLTRGADRDAIVFETTSGLVACRREGPWTFSADMGRPRFGWRDIPLSRPVADTTAVEMLLPASCAGLGRPAVVSMGNPHAVFWTSEPDRFDLATIGPILERHQDFPERVNVSLANVANRRRIVLRVWERGAGLTRACGTAACAALVSAARLGMCERRGVVVLPGGELQIAWGADDRVLMTGPCELEREGRLDAAAFEPTRG
jgi:diaminopimelate epimerase